MTLALLPEDDLGKSISQSSLRDQSSDHLDKISQYLQSIKPFSDSHRAILDYGLWAGHLPF